MIALPFHPSNAYTIREFKANAADLLHQVDVAAKEQLGVQNAPSLLSKLTPDGFRVDQGVIAGCSGGTYQNLKRAAEILKGSVTGPDAFWLSCYPGSMPINLELTKQGCLTDLMAAGASIRSCFCGPCFGGGGRARQRRVFHPPLHPQLPQPGGKQARRRPNLLRSPDGRPVHCRHGEKRRTFDRRRRAA